MVYQSWVYRIRVCGWERGCVFYCGLLLLWVGPRRQLVEDFSRFFSFPSWAKHLFSVWWLSPSGVTLEIDCMRASQWLGPRRFFPGRYGETYTHACHCSAISPHHKYRRNYVSAP